MNAVVGSPENRPLVAMDMDGVIVPYTGELARVFNRRHAKTHGEIDGNWREYRIEHQFRPPVSDLLYEIMHEPGFFAAIEPHDDAEQALRELCAFADVEICSSPPIQKIGDRRTLNAYAAADKIGWLFRRFNDLELASNVTLTLKKDKLRADVLVDDDPVGNVIPWCKAHPDGLGYLVARSWNADLEARGLVVPPNLHRGPLSEAPGLIRRWWSSRSSQRAS